MKFLIFFIFITTYSLNGFSQNQEDTITLVKTYDLKPAQKAKFDLGYVEMKFYIARNIMQLQDDSLKHGTGNNIVYFNLHISAKGVLEDVTFQNGGCIDEDLTKQLLIEEKTTWIAGKDITGQKIPSVLRVPMRIITK